MAIGQSLASHLPTLVGRLVDAIPRRYHAAFQGFHDVALPDLVRMTSTEPLLGVPVLDRHRPTEDILGFAARTTYSMFGILFPSLAHGFAFLALGVQSCIDRDPHRRADAFRSALAIACEKFPLSIVELLPLLAQSDPDAAVKTDLGFFGAQESGRLCPIEILWARVLVAYALQNPLAATYILASGNRKLEWTTPFHRFPLACLWDAELYTNAIRAARRILLRIRAEAYAEHVALMEQLGASQLPPYHEITESIATNLYAQYLVPVPVRGATEDFETIRPALHPTSTEFGSETAKTTESKFDEIVTDRATQAILADPSILTEPVQSNPESPGTSKAQ